jgi:II/X family phage/plasmid replication protein
VIDWITFYPNLIHPVLDGGRVFSVKPDGEIEWESKKLLGLCGSHESNLHVKTSASVDGVGTQLMVTGNPTKWLQGHNLFGTDDLRALVLETMHRLTSLLSLTPTPEEKLSWETGNYGIGRVDINYSYDLPSRAAVRAWLRAAEFSAHLKNRGRGQLMKGGTLYFGKQSRRWSIKIYGKGDEIEAPKHTLPDALSGSGLAAWADKKLRVELVLRSMQLKECRLDRGCYWDDNSALELHRVFTEGLTMSEQVSLSNTTLDGLPPRLQLTYNSWKNGEDLRAILPKKTFYRYRSQLMLLGIDIAIRQPHEDRSNVVPLRRVLEAIPAPIPEWAYGTPLLWEPPARKVS